MFSFLLPTSIIFVFFLFLKMGFLFFGGGYVLIPILHKELVLNLHLLSERQFIDGTAISQLTPGPIAILATFAGYCIKGTWGAVVATIATFLPGSCLMLFLSKNYEKILSCDLAYRMLDTVAPVVVGLLVATSIQLFLTSSVNSLFILFFIGSIFLLVKFKINPAMLIIFALCFGILS